MSDIGNIKLTEEQCEYTRRQIKQADDLLAELLTAKKPYLREYKIVSRVNRKMCKIRKAKRELEDYLLKGVGQNCG